jgi:predicted metalloprotease
MGEVRVTAVGDKERDRTEGSQRDPGPVSASAGILGLVTGVLVAALLIILDQLGIYSGAQRSREVAYDFLGGAIAGLLFYIYTRR